MVFLGWFYFQNTYQINSKVPGEDFLPHPALSAAAAKSLQSCPTVRPHRWQPTRFPHPWDSPGKNTGVGCHFLLQCMKVKSESEVAQSCLTLSDPMDCSPPGSSIHETFQARVLEWGATAFSAALSSYPENSPDYPQMFQNPYSKGIYLFLINKDARRAL